MPEAATLTGTTQNTTKTAGAEVLPAQEPLMTDFCKKPMQRFAIQTQLTVGAPDDPYEKEADSVADQVMRMPEQNFLQRKCAACAEKTIQREENEEKEPADKSKLTLQLTEPDFLSLRTPFFDRNAMHLWDPGSALGVWQYNFSFFRRFGLDDNWSGKAANLTTPLFINSQLKAGNPTWWEVTDSQLNTSSIVGSVPVFSFDSDFKNWKPLPFLQKKSLETPEVGQTAGGHNESFIQRKCTHCEEEEKINREPLSASITPFIQAKSENGMPVSSELGSAIQSSRGSGTSMDNHTQTFMSSRFSADFSNVKVHTDGEAVQMNRDLNAKAFTVGNDVYFNSGQYQPGSSEGKRLLAHELAHTVQQGGGNAGAQTKTIIQRDLAAPQPGVCDKNNMGSLGPTFVKKEAEVKKLNLEKRKLVTSAADKEFVLYCPHRSSVALKPLVSGSSVYFIANADAKGVKGKDEVWAVVENENEMVWGFIKNTYYAPVAQTEKNAFEELATGAATAASVQPEYLPYAVNEINRMGKMASDIKSYEDVKTTGKIIRNIPDPGNGKEVARIKFNELLIVKASNASADWLYVTTTDGRQGWTQRVFVAENIPDQNATIYHTPNREALEPILANHYRAVDPYPIKTGDDLRILAMAIYIANVQDGRVGLDKDQLDADFKTTLKDIVDPWNEENRRVYRSLRVTASNVWLPGSQYVNLLKDQGIISTRPDWMNVVIDAGKAIIGFNAGMISGFFGGIWDMLKGLYELARDLVKLVGSVFSGCIIDDLKSLYEDIKGLTADKIIEMVKGVFSAIWDELKDFYKKLTAENTWDKWFFRGEIVGLICLEVVLFLLSGGAANAAKWIAKLAKYAPKLARFLLKLITKVDDVLPGKMKKKHGEPGDTDIEPDNDRNREKLTALSLAKGITEVQDAKDTDVDLLLVSLQPIAIKYKVKFDYTSTSNDTYDIDMIASRKRVKTRYTAPKKIITEIPFKSLRGKSLKYIKRNKPSGWQTNPTRDHEGFIWTDTKGTERLRFMRGKDDDIDIKYQRERNGYFRWQDENGRFLDIDGNVIPNTDPDFQAKTHIAYEGIED